MITDQNSDVDKRTGKYFDKSQFNRGFIIFSYKFYGLQGTHFGDYLK